MHDIKIEGGEFVAEMELGIIIERAAAIMFEPVRNCPADHVAQRVEIKVQIERYAVIKPDTFIINRVAVNEAKRERDDFSILSPNEESRPFPHSLTNPAEIFFG